MFDDHAVLNTEHVKPCSRVLLGAVRRIRILLHEMIMTRSPSAMIATTWRLMVGRMVCGFANRPKNSTNPATGGHVRVVLDVTLSQILLGELEMAALQHFAPHVIDELLVGGELRVAALQQRLLVGSTSPQSPGLELGGDGRKSQNQYRQIPIHECLLWRT